MTVIDNEIRKQYLKDNNLLDSHIDIKILYQYRGTLPARISVGTKNNMPLFFEETASSLMKRHYGYNDKVTRYKLICNCDEIHDLRDVIITNDNYTIDFLKKFINTLDKNVNLIDPKQWKRGRKTIVEGRRKHMVWCNDEEFEYVKEFIKRLRGRNENN